MNVDTFIISSHLLGPTIAFLRSVGMANAEGFVIWGGVFENEHTFRFRSVLIPAQRAVSTESGLLVIVEGDALFEVNKTLYQRGEILAGQVHTHPSSAYHSDTDDHYPLATLVGSVSVVVPDFARYAPADLRFWAWYRLTGYGSWAPLSTDTNVRFE